MTSHREPGGHWAKLAGQREGQPIVSSVRVVYRTNGPHEVTDVKDWSEPPVDHL